MSTVLAQVRRQAVDHDLLPRGSTVLAACSGGPDSVALVDLLDRLAPELGFALVIGSIDHGLRAESADEVASVGSLAAELERPFRSRRLDLAGGAGLQARARDARLGALQVLAGELGADRIALGHTADDQAETVLARLLRGAGVRGLGAMAPARPMAGALLVRPMLTCRREALRAHLDHMGRSWVRDPSNEDPRFERVRLRALIAQLEAEDARLVDHLTDLADDARAHTEVVTAAAIALGESPALEALRAAPGAIRRAAIRAWAARMGFALGRAHLEALEALVLTGRGAVLVPGGQQVTLEGGGLALGPGPARTRSAPATDDRAPVGNSPPEFPTES